ncbi:hypothetical protein E3P92_00354 [Wallemia ichthyophaga]|nr:hypothetical protein E3P92_00354 [Wallemia ichthyophaga]
MRLAPPQLPELDTSKPVAALWLLPLPYIVITGSLLFLPLHLRRIIGIPVCFATTVYPLVYLRQPDPISAYMVGNAQIYALMIAGYLLSVDVEKRLVKLDARGIERPPPTGLWERIVFFADLLSNPRGIHWKWARRIDKQGVETEGDKTWKRFIAERLAVIAMHILIIDAFETYLHTPPYDILTLRPIAAQPVLLQAFHLAFFGGVAYSAINAFNLSASVVCVGVGVSSPRDWPPFFNLTEAWSIGRLWAVGWHSVFRQTIKFYGDNIASVFPERAHVPVKLVVAFSLTGASHAMGAYVLAGLGRGQFCFFVVQAVGIVVEYLVFGNTLAQSPATSSRKLLGYIYTAIFVGITSRPFLDEFVSSGLCTPDMIPFSISRGILYGQRHILDIALVPVMVSWLCHRTVMSEINAASDDEESYYDGSYDEDSDDFIDMEQVLQRRSSQALLDDMLLQDSTNDEIADEDGDHGARLSILQMLLRNARAGTGRHVFVSDEGDGLMWQARMPDMSQRYVPTPSTTQPEGVKLAQSGMFGCTRTPVSLQGSIRNRTRLQSRLRPEYLAVVPNSSGCVVARNNAPVYSGEHSRDGQLFYTADRNFNINVYKPQEPLRAPHSGMQGEDEFYVEEHETTMGYLARVSANPSGWTVTDANLSHNKEWLVYSRISPVAHLVNLNNPAQPIPLSFSDDGADDYGYGYGIWSVRFSSDCKEIVAGAADGTMYVYDVEARKKLLSLEGHMADVNAVCFADVSSNICVSGSDDCVAKVWDRRALTSHAKPSGVLVGHTEGITYVSPKGNERNVLTNGKDSSVRIWDLRRMVSSDDFDDSDKVAPPENFSIPGYDYRSSFTPKPAYDAHPQDHSLVRLQGHTVARTLIRARFSPDDTTGGRYVYSGSADGNIYIWNVSGELVQVVDRKSALDMVDASGEFNDPSAPEVAGASVRNTSAPASGRARARRPIVRDVSWSPTDASLMSTAWEWDETGSVARHDWKDLNKLNYSLESWVDIERANAE